jgi:hypothetical protein
MGVVAVAKVIALSLDPGNYFHHWPQQAPPFGWPCIASTHKRMGEGFSA